jgi:hypothetical protein
MHLAGQSAVAGGQYVRYSPHPNWITEYRMRRAIQHIAVIFAMVLAGGLVGCGSSKLPPAAERLPGKWHGEMIVYDEMQGKLPPEKIAELSNMQWDFDFRTDGSMALSGANSGTAFNTEGRWQTLKQDGDLLTIKSTEQSGAQKDINIEFDGKDTFYIPVNGRPSPEAEVAELGAMRFTRLR